MKSQTKRQISPFTSGELEAMRNQAEDDLLLFLLLRWTGLRAIDAVDLTWREVSLDQQQIEHVGGKNLSKAILPIHAELWSAFRAEYQRCNPRQDDPVLQHSDGKPFTRGYLCRRITALGRRSGVEGAYPHRFRQTFAVDLLLRGASPLYVAELLGNKITTVVRHLPSVREVLRLTHATFFPPPPALEPVLKREPERQPVGLQNGRSGRMVASETSPVLTVRKRGETFHADLVIRGVHAVRGSLGTRNRDAALRSIHLLDIALWEGPLSAVWAELRIVLPPATFSRFAEFVGFKESQT